MATAAAEREYVDVNATDFSPEVQAMLKEERSIYNMMKAHKAAILAKVQQEVAMPQGKEISSMAYTRWGQLQLVIAPKAEAKVATKRPSLAAYLAQAAQ